MPLPPPDFNHENKVNHTMVGAIVLIMVVITTILVGVIRYKPEGDNVWRIGITNWPGYDNLYLAAEKGFLKENGLNIRFIPVNSITDMRTAFERGLIDGYTGTIQDVVDSLQNSRTPSHIVMVTDYSSGGDQLLADPSITTVDDLKGKRIGLEITSSVGRYMLARALTGSGISSNDVSLHPANQIALTDQAIRGNLDAIITYEPYATRIRASRPMHMLFDSSKIPGEIIDVLAVSPHMLQAEPDLSRRLQKAWQSSIDYANAYPDESVTVFAHRYGMSTYDYKKLVSDTSIYDSAAMQRFTSSNGLHEALTSTARILNPFIPFTDANASSIISVWFQQEVRQ